MEKLGVCWEQNPQAKAAQGGHFSAMPRTVSCLLSQSGASSGGSSPEGSRNPDSRKKSRQWYLRSLSLGPQSPPAPSLPLL